MFWSLSRLCGFWVTATGKTEDEVAKVTRIPARGRKRHKDGGLTDLKQQAIVFNPQNQLCKDISIVLRDFELETYRDLFGWFQRSGVREEGL